MNPMTPEGILENLDMDPVVHGLVLLNHGDHFEDRDLLILDGPEVVVEVLKAVIILIRTMKLEQDHLRRKNVPKLLNDTKEK